MAECDTRVRPATPLSDARQLINTHVQAVIRAAFTQPTTQERLQKVYNDLGASLGGDARVIRSKIQHHFDQVGAPYVFKTTQNSTKYAGINYGIWHLPAEAGVLDSSMKIGSVRIGLDKLGHFFQQGHEYYEMVTVDGKTLAEAIAWGKSTERYLYGGMTTGVYSRADLVANLAGYNYYKALAANPNMVFDIGQYITPKWNEEKNPNVYKKKVIRRIWKNILTKTATQWAGKLKLRSGREVQITFSFKAPNPAQAGVHATATYSYTLPTAQGAPAKQISGSINCTIITSDVAEGGAENLPMHASEQIILDCTWARGNVSGNARLINMGSETALQGTWGELRNPAGGGEIKLSAQ